MERQVVFEVDECTIRRLTDVICFPILEDSPDSLTMKHLLDVCTYFSHSEVLGFSVESCLIPYPPHYKAAFAFSNFSLLPPNSMPHGLPALRCAGREDSFSTFRIIDPMNNLGEPSTPAVHQFRAGS